MKTISFLLLTSLLFWSCTKTDEFTDTITIYEEDGQLPVYSEWGYNTFGAYIERTVYESNTYDVPFKVIADSNYTKLMFSGTFHDSYSYSYSNNSNLTLTLSIQNYAPDTYQDFLRFHDSVVVLNNTEHLLTMKTDSLTDTLYIIDGLFHIKRVQDLRVDQTHKNLILSGEFGIKALRDGNPITISDGRFDFVLSNHNFYKL